MNSENSKIRLGGIGGEETTCLGALEIVKPVYNTNFDRSVLKMFD
jgi:hypothetical protein